MQKKSLKWKSKTQIPENTSYRMIFGHEHAEDISYVYVVCFNRFLTFLRNKIKKDRPPTYDIAQFQITVLVRFGSVWFWSFTVLLIAQFQITVLVRYGFGWSQFYQLSGLAVFCCVLFIRNWEFDGRSPSVFCFCFCFCFAFVFVCFCFVFCQKDSPWFGCIMYCYRYRQLSHKNVEVSEFNSLRE